jgi:TolB protein
MLAAWNPYKPSGVKSPLGRAQQQPGPTTLFLVDPAGGRYNMDTLPAEPPNSPVPRDLVAWSGDGQRALLANSLSSKVAVLDLRTGASTEFSLGAGARPLGFTAPGGLAILASAGADPARPRLERFSLTGTREQAYPASFTGGGRYDGASAVYSPDGTELVVGTSSAMELMTNAGQVIRSLRVSSPVGNCTPVCWWTPATLLASCFPAGSTSPQLWLVPASGARATALTASPAAHGDLGDLSAWPLPGAGTYVQDEGACGYLYLGKLQSNGQTTPVSVPGVPSGHSTIVIGSYGGKLAIQANTACGGLPSLMWFAPATNTVTPLLGGAANGGYTGGALLFGETAYIRA